MRRPGGMSPLRLAFLSISRPGLTAPRLNRFPQRLDYTLIPAPLGTLFQPSVYVSYLTRLRRSCAPFGR